MRKELVHSFAWKSKGSDISTNVIKISFVTEILQSVYTKITVKKHLLNISNLTHQVTKQMCPCRI